MPERAGPTLRAASPVYPEDSVVVRQRRTEERPVEARCSSLDSSLLQPSLFLRWSVGRTLVASLRSVRCVCFTATSENGATRTLARRPGLRSQTVTADTVKISTTRGGISGGKEKRAKHRRLGVTANERPNVSTRYCAKFRNIVPTSTPVSLGLSTSLVRLSFCHSSLPAYASPSSPFSLSRFDTTRGDDEGGQ